MSSTTVSYIIQYRLHTVRPHLFHDFSSYPMNIDRHRDNIDDNTEGLFF